MKNIKNKTVNVHKTCSIERSKSKTTKEGYLIAQARFARSGILYYLPEELFGDDIPEIFTEKGYVAVYEPIDVLSSADTIESIKNKDIIIDHEFVDVENQSENTIGHVTSKVKIEQDYLAGEIIIKNKKGIDKINNTGYKYMSTGSTSVMQYAPGIYRDQFYDMILVSEYINHVALTDSPRGGMELQVFNSTKNKQINPIGDNTMTTKKTETIKFGEIEVEVDLENAVKINSYLDSINKSHAKLKNSKDELNKKIDELTAVNDANAEKIKELKTELKNAKSEELIDKRVEEKLKVLKDAKEINPDADYTGLSDINIKRTALKDNKDLSEKSDSYVNAYFDIILENKASLNKDQENIQTEVTKSVNKETKTNEQRVQDRTNKLRNLVIK